MTSSTVISSNESWHNGISEDLERIYTSITTPEERVVMEPFKSLFEEINTTIIDGTLTLSDTKNNAYRNKCLSWCRRAREASRLLPRHLVIDCGCVVLRVWFRWALRYFSDQISAHCKHFPHVFGELDDSCVAPLEGDGTGNSRKLSRDEVMQCAADSCNDVLRLYLDGDEQSLFVLRAAFDDLAQMHGFLDLFCRLGAQLSHQMGVHRADLDGIMDSVFVGYRTHAWIRRWVLLLVGAIHIHSPITAWMNAKDSLFQQWEPTRLMYLAPCWMAFGAFGKLTQHMFEEEKTQVDFVMTVAVMVFNEHMLRFVCPLAEWAVQTSTTSVVQQDDADEMKEADDCMTDNTDDAHTRAYHFLKELNQYVLANTTFMSKCLYGSTMAMDESVIDYFRALVSSYLTRAPTSTDGSNLTNTLLYQLVQRGYKCTLDHFFRGEAHSDSKTATDEDFEVSTGEVDEAERDVRTDDVGAKIRRFPDEYDRYECKIDDSDDAAHVVETLFDIRHRLFMHDTGYPYWQRLFPGSQPRETVELAVRTIEGIFVRSIEIYLMQVYSASPRETWEHEKGRMHDPQTLPKDSHIEQNHLRRQKKVLFFIRAATRCVRRLMNVEPVASICCKLVYFGMKRIFASMTPDEIHMYLGSIADSIHNFLVDACRGSATLTRGAIDAANKSFSSWMILSNELVRVLPTVGLIEEKGSTAWNTVNDSHKRREEEMCIVYLMEARNLLFQMAWRIASTGIAHCHGKQKAPADPNDQSCIRIHDLNHLREVLSLPMPLVNVPESFQKVDVFFRFMDAALRLRRLPTPPSNSAWTEIEVRRRGREMVVLVPSSMESTVVKVNRCLYSLILSFATKHGLYVPVLDEQPSLTCLQCRIPPPALIVHFFDARHWGFDSSTCFLITQIRAATCCASSSTRTTSTPQTQSSSDAEELPFPADLAAALVDYTHEYKQQQHHEQQLHWCRDYAYTTFVMYYPRDGGLPTTIHGTLHLQRLFVALAGYKRVGVTWSRLAARAHVSVEELKEQLHKCVEFGLLVCIGKNDNEGNGVEHVAMNYDYVRPVESTEFVIVLWPKFPRPLKEILGGAKKFPNSETISGANCVEKLAPVVMSIMKQRKKIPYPELVGLVHAAVHTHKHTQTCFAPIPPMIKSCVEGLIARKYIQRAVKDGSSHLVSSAVVLEYMP